MHCILIRENSCNQWLILLGSSPIVFLRISAISAGIFALSLCNAQPVQKDNKKVFYHLQYYFGAVVLIGLLRRAVQSHLLVAAGVSYIGRFLSFGIIVTVYFILAFCKTTLVIHFFNSDIARLQTHQ
jgi:hypothetical protein